MYRNESYVEIHDDGIIVIGVVYKYQLRLKMSAYACAASVADFRHHLYFLSKIIAPDAFMAYLSDWKAYLMLNRSISEKKTGSLINAIRYYEERTKAKL